MNNYKQAMSSVWKRGALMLALMGMHATTHAAIGFKSTHGQEQAMGIAGYIIIGFFVVGIALVGFGIFTFTKLNDEQARGSEKAGVATKIIAGIGAIGLGVVIEFFTGAVLGESEVSTPDGMGDLW